MIEKLDLIENTDNLYDKNGFITNVACGSATISKVNELIDAVNELQEFADVADKNLAKLMEEATRPENVQPDVESRPENMPGPIKLYVCPDGSVYDNEDVAKSHAASIFNPSPAGATTTDRVYLEQELERTRKALDVAVNALDRMAIDDNVSGMIARNAIKEIKALEQKDK